eukprot:428039_1
MIRRKKQPFYNNNILLCGYFRQYENNTKNTLPQLVQYTIYIYSKEYIVFKMPDSDISRHIFSDTIPHSEQLRVGHSSEHLYTATTIPHTKTIMNPKQFRAFTAHIKENVIDIAYGAHHTLFLTQNGSVYSYGQNGSGQCGIHTNGKQIIKPQLIPINFKITEIAAGKLHSLFIDTKKRLLVCGYNYCGQLGINNNIEMNVEDDSSDSDSDSDSDFYFEDTSENLTKYEPTINEYFE